MLIVAVTGGIGSGKSTVSGRLAERGALLVDSDQVAREVVAPGSAGLTAIAARFGDTVISPDGSLNRPALAAIVFNDPTAREALNGITHPLVRRRFAEVVNTAPADALIVNDIPLLTTVEVATSFALVIGVGADEERRVGRLITRGLSEDDARSRMRAQITDEERRPLTDHWLDNNGTTDDLLGQVDQLWTDRLSVMNDNLTRGVPAPDIPAPGFSELTSGRIRRAIVQSGLEVVTMSETGSTAEVLAKGTAGGLAEELLRAGYVPVATDVYRSADPMNSVTVRLVVTVHE